MRQRGFTLIELMIVVGIVALLASAALPLAKLNAIRVKESELRAAEREIRSAIDAYKDAVNAGHIAVEVGASGYPPTLMTLVDGVEDAQSVEKKKLYFIRRLPRDPFYPNGAIQAEATWGLRSSDSSSQEPHAGDDVFDVYSLSNDIGLNGAPYREW